MVRGRPVKTIIRERIASILLKVNSAYGYELYKIYRSIFGPISLRNLYYNLKKGVATGEFIIVDVKRESGAYTWGNETQHIYYMLGPYAIFHNLTEKQKQAIEALSSKQKEIDWLKEIMQKVKELDQEVTTFLAISERMRYEDRRKLRETLKLRGAKLKDWASNKIDKEKLKEINNAIDDIVKRLY